LLGQIERKKTYGITTIVISIFFKNKGRELPTAGAVTGLIHEKESDKYEYVWLYGI